MAELKTIDHIEKIQPEGFEACGLPKAPYYVIHYEDGTTEEADFIAEHDEDVFVDDEESGFVPMTHEEFLAHLDSALHELKLSLEGKVKFQPIENLFAELAREDEDDEEEAKAIAQ